jgi:hypothetical protein
MPYIMKHNQHISMIFPSESDLLMPNSDIIHPAFLITKNINSANQLAYLHIVEANFSIKRWRRYNPRYFRVPMYVKIPVSSSRQLTDYLQKFQPEEHQIEHQIEVN